MESIKYNKNSTAYNSIIIPYILIYLNVIMSDNIKYYEKIVKA